MKQKKHWFLVFLFFLSPLGSVRAADVTQVLNEGTLLYEKGYYDKALRVFMKAKTLDPSNRLAREYISRCTERIVEKETGERLKKAVIRSEAASATVDEKEEIPRWAQPAKVLKTDTDKPSVRKKPGRVEPVTPGVVLNRSSGASEATRMRAELVQSYQDRVLEGNAIELTQRGGHAEITVFLNRVFLPLSDTLAPDAVVSLENTARQLRKGKPTTVVLRGADSLTPAIRHQMINLPSRRAAILFAYFTHAVLGSPPPDTPLTFTADDLDD